MKMRSLKLVNSFDNEVGENCNDTKQRRSELHIKAEYNGMLDRAEKQVKLEQGEIDICSGT